MPACGARYSYRRSMSYMPEWRTCTLDLGHPKRHGQKAAPTPVDAEPSATCQICFREQQTRAQRLVLHGYRRPGFGYIVGECWGVGYAPFEVSCERTKQYIEEVLRATLARWEANLQRLQARPEAMPYQAKIYVGFFHDRADSRKSPYCTVTFQVAKGAPATWAKTDIVAKKRTHWGAGPIIEVGDFEQANLPAYDEILGRAIQKQESDIRMVKKDIQTYEAKVAEWKPVPWPALKAVA